MFFDFNCVKICLALLLNTRNKIAATTNGYSKQSDQQILTGIKDSFQNLGPQTNKIQESQKWKQKICSAIPDIYRTFPNFAALISILTFLG